jgi:hypothetical protein
MDENEDEHQSEEPGRSVCLGDGNPLSLGSLARIELDPQVHSALDEARERFELASREHLLARITLGERVFIEYACQHPEKTEQEVMAALDLRESTVLAYYNHLGRNFKVRTIAQLRRWAMKKQVVSMPKVDPVEPVDEPEKPPVDPPDKRFDPWARRF